MESGQSQFAPLKLRSLALVSSSGAQSAPSNYTCASSTARLFLPRPGAPVTDSRSFRGALRALQEIRSRDCDRTSRPQTLAGQPPSGSRGESINARESQCRRDRQFPESAYINIIPSGLCNKSPRAALVSASHTIRIMLSTLRQ